MFSVQQNLHVTLENMNTNGRYISEGSTRETEPMGIDRQMYIYIMEFSQMTVEFG